MSVNARIIKDINRKRRGDKRDKRKQPQPHTLEITALSHHCPDDDGKGQSEMAKFIQIGIGIEACFITYLRHSLFLASRGSPTCTHFSLQTTKK